MPRISLTDFVDIVSSSGTPKATRVGAAKNRPDYQPALDYYKQVRDAIVENHKRGGAKKDLKARLGVVLDCKKLANYTVILNGYQKWWGRKNLSWYKPPTSLHSAHGVEISVNPELGLLVGGDPYIVKLYFKSDKLSKNRVDVICHLMEVRLRSSSPVGAIMSVLDVRRGKLFSPTVPISKLNAMLDAELAYVATLWPQL